VEEKRGNINQSYLKDVIRDIEKYLSEFPNRNFAIKHLASQSKLNSKTLKRILEQQSTPSYQSLFKIYRVIHNTDNESEIINNVSSSIAAVLRKSNPVNLKKFTDNKIDLLMAIKANPLAGELYILAGTQNISLNAIAYRYGQFGVETLEDMLEQNILIEVKSKEYSINPQLPRLTAEIIKELGIRLVKRFANTEICDEQGHNLLALYAESLNEDGIAEWLKIDTEAFHKKVSISKQDKYKGHIPYFTFQSSDQLNPRNTK
jgi:AraC-like DNA-binding protein